MNIRKKLLLLAALFTVTIPASSQAITPQNSTNTNNYNTWYNTDVGAYFGDYPNASIVYDGTNLVIDVTHGGGTVLFPHGLAGTVSPLLTSGHILVGNASNVGTDVAMSGAVAIDNTGATSITNGAINNATINPTAGIQFSKLEALNAGNIIVGGPGNVPTQMTASGAFTLNSSGVATLGAGVVANPNVVDSNGTATLSVMKSAIAVYDFATDGGGIGGIAISTPTIPDNAVIWVDSYEVQTTLTSATDAATVSLGFPTDGNLFTPIAISAGSNPWDAGIFVAPLGGMVAQTPKKLTAARPLFLNVADENLTAGRIIFHLSYWVSN